MKKSEFASHSSTQQVTPTAEIISKLKHVLTASSLSVVYGR